ncbi:hypothetical protein NDK47_09740 [Brevibacillus ruminantium]|uniref:Uncharacterized protein n=1 Tax=Brevibacillus ruminantium TaxID=2950604 RepID=A0ABY4WK38_9BACL|nr:hypothetical protein [Brevibacillus ruminantium]USG67528.1 hypothetical protein NDK47_09740 [Brevibacillus ruminantium]
MKRMFGIEMHVPSGKLPGFYAQVIHKIGDHVNVFDRDEQLLIVDNEQERDKLAQLLEQASMLGEEFALWLLPASASIDHLEDIGFESQAGHVYLYTDRVTAFSLDLSSGQQQDRWAALEQMKESTFGLIPGEAGDLYLTDPEQELLIEGIARAYQVSVNWLASRD